MADLGNTSFSGSSTRAIDNGSWRGVVVTFPEDPQAGVTVTAYIGDSATGDSFKAALISTSDGTTVLAESAVRTDISTAGWYTFSGGGLATFDGTNGQSVYVMVGSNSSASAVMHWASTQTADGYTATSSSFSPLTISFATAIDGSARDYFVYLTYTAAGGSPAIAAFARGSNIILKGY